MNADARELGLRDTRFANPIGLDEAGNYSTASDLAKLAIAAAAQRVRPRDDRPPARDAAARGSRRRTIVNRNTLVRAVPAVNGVKTGHTLRRGLRPRRLGDARRDHGRQRRAWASRARRCATATPLRAPAPRPGRVPRAHAAAPGRGPGAREARLPRRARRGRRVGHRAADHPPRRSASASQVAGASRRGRRAAARAAPGSARAMVRLGDEVVARVPLVTASAVAEATLGDRSRTPRTASSCRSCWRCALAGSLLDHDPAPTRSAAPSSGAPTGEEGGVIITVTLNAAIDKSLSVPNFRLGRRHRTVEQQTLAGGKGVNVARTLKTLGAPVIATGLAGGPTGTRIVEQLTEESILNDFVRIREESRTNTAVARPDDGRADGDQRARPGGHRAGDRALPRQAHVPGARRGSGRLRGLAAARRRARPLLRPHPRWSPKPASPPWSTPTASRCATRCARSPT